MRWRGEICKRCYKPNHIGYELENLIWREISENSYNILCIPCLDELATDKRIDWVSHLIGELYPCSTVCWDS